MLFPFGGEDLYSRAVVAEYEAAAARGGREALRQRRTSLPFRSTLANTLAHWALHLDRGASERVLSAHTP